MEQYSNIKIIRDLARKKRLKVFLVGGFLRDLLLGRPKIDFDFAVSKSALKLAKSFSTKIKGAYVLLDKERGCARVCKKTKEGMATYDFADFRAKTFLGDLNKRDFTINTLYLDLNDLTVDPSLEAIIGDKKSAKKDLDSKKIKMVSAAAFREDPLRILRAYSLVAQLGFKIEKKTLMRMKKDRELLRGVSYERIRDELFKVLSSQEAGKLLKQMSRDGVLEVIIPQIRVMYNCEQGTYHHLDVWPHSLETVTQLDSVFRQFQDAPEINEYLDEPLAGERTRRSVMRLAALLHDIGKPQTKVREKGRTSFHGHEHVGKGIVRPIAKMLKLSTRERHILEDIVRWHLRPGYLSNFKQPSEKAVYRYLRDTKEEAISILLVSLADQRSTCGPATTEYDQKHHEAICLDLIQQYLKKKKEKPFIRLLNGDDLIRELKLKPSPLFKRILSEVEERQTLGECASKQQALKLARELVDKL
ncbi:MAG TPA: HD domain-containing protein [Candidatus Omnitrophota bacterium]|nr:HD domain-containing protein [Candidatus Omnitrophota bacterium]